MTSPSTAYAPQKFVLINAGSYDYAEVELRGSLQIVGPNNTGKTTLINTLQFLYIDDRRQMNFGEHTHQETCDFYFPNQYSYVLFESLGARGTFVLGWRGQSKIVGGDPQRFCYQGSFDPNDFLNEKGQVREPPDVSDRLGMKGYALIKSDAEHRDMLLLPTRGEPQGSGGAGLVALQPNAQYPQFRETLKNLLCLSTITQDQMRERLLMLAGLPTGKQSYALDVRKLFGDEYDRLLELKQKLKSFKEHVPQIGLLVESYDERERLRGEQMYLWTHMRAKRDEFQEAHNAELASLRARIEAAIHGAEAAKTAAEESRDTVKALSETKGALNTQLAQIASQTERFKNFEEDLANGILANTRSEIQKLEKQLEDAAAETREAADAKIERYRKQIEQRATLIEQFDHAMITVLRRDLDDVTLASLAGLFNFELLHLPVRDGGIRLDNREGLLAQLAALSQRIQSGVYRDSNVELPLPANERSLAELADPEAVRAQLREDEKSLKHWERILESIIERESIEKNLNKARLREADCSEQLFGWKQFQKLKAEEPVLRDELNRTMAAMRTAEERSASRGKEREQHEKAQQAAELSIEKQTERYDDVMDSWRECNWPDFAGTTNIMTPSETPPDRFDPLVTYFLSRLKRLADLDG